MSPRLVQIESIKSDTMNWNEKVNRALERVESIMGKAENAGFQQFYLFPQCFQKHSL